MTLARLVLLVSLGGAPHGVALQQGDRLCGRCPDTNAAVVVAARHGAVESLALRESARLDVTTRSGHAAPAALTAAAGLTTVDPVGACSQRRRAVGQSAVCSSSALRGPPASI